MQVNDCQERTELSVGSTVPPMTGAMATRIELFKESSQRQWVCKRVADTRKVRHQGVRARLRLQNRVLARRDERFGSCSCVDLDTMRSASKTVLQNRQVVIVQWKPFEQQEELEEKTCFAVHPSKVLVSDRTEFFQVARSDGSVRTRDWPTRTEENRQKLTIRATTQGEAFRDPRSRVRTCRDLGRQLEGWRGPSSVSEEQDGRSLKCAWSSQAELSTHPVEQACHE